MVSCGDFVFSRLGTSMGLRRRNSCACLRKVWGDNAGGLGHVCRLFHPLIKKTASPSHRETPFEKTFRFFSSSSAGFVLIRSGPVLATL
jgi:hypothetical protein